MTNNVTQRPHWHTYGMWAIGLAVVICLTVIGWLIKASGQATLNGPVNNGPSINTFNQSGGNNTINVGHSRLTFDAAIAEDLMRRLPIAKPIVIQSVGPPRDQLIADQYERFLTEHGATLKGRARFGAKSPSPDHPIEIDERPDAVFVVIDPSVIP